MTTERLPLWWLTTPSSTAASVCFRATSNGKAYLKCNGKTVSVNCDTSVDDGVVRFPDITGLSPDSSYHFTVKGAVAADDFSGNLKTFPASGAARLVVTGCQENYGYSDHIQRTLEHNPHAYFQVGDFNYQGNGEGYGGISTLRTNDSFANDTDIQNRYNEYRFVYSHPQFRQLMTQVPLAITPDDHEFDKNNCYWDLGVFNAASGYTLTTEAEMQAIVDAANTGMLAYTKGQPRAIGYDNGALYFSIEVGNMLVIMLSCIQSFVDTSDSTRGIRPLRGTPDTGQLMISAQQEQFILDECRTTDKPFKVVVSNKSTSEVGVQLDGWRGNLIQRNRILQAIHDAVGWKVPGGVVWAGSDAHQPLFVSMEAGVDGATFDHVQMSCSASMNGPHSSATQGVAALTSPDAYTRFSVNDSGFHTCLPYQGIICLESADDDSYIDIFMVSLSGNEVMRGRVLAGQNKLSEIPDAPVSI